MVSRINPLFEKHIQARIFNLKTLTTMRNLNPSDGYEIREAMFRCLVCGYFSEPIVVDKDIEPGVTHILVTGGAVYIGSHASLRLLKESYRVTIIDNLSRGNLGDVKSLQELFPEPGRLQFIYADLGDSKAVNKIFSENAFDAVIHFAALAYIGESTAEPLRYYHNITSNTLVVLEAMVSQSYVHWFPCNTIQKL
ncbi:UDP-arabinose 4-epimerase [Heracleum sosnowskyi]|uniref:UDP-arabinose 4-epimerase n=1 Tax=Heracleum sosnowskyi TaxID=360622 RepID=A0AAD8IYL5_9APIA|nr:UDP-arabinose 4-epimerase [Heracleum sosnowskyi]